MSSVLTHLSHFFSGGVDLAEACENTTLVDLINASKTLRTSEWVEAEQGCLKGIVYDVSEVQVLRSLSMMGPRMRFSGVTPETEVWLRDEALTAINEMEVTLRSGDFTLDKITEAWKSSCQKTAQVVYPWVAEGADVTCTRWLEAWSKKNIMKMRKGDTDAISNVVFTAQQIREATANQLSDLDRSTHEALAKRSRSILRAFDDSHALGTHIWKDIGPDKNEEVKITRLIAALF